MHLTKKINILQSDIVNAKKSLSSAAYKIETREQSEPLASGFVLQVGAFKILERANLLKDNLNKKGYSAFVTVARMSDAGEILHRVVIGSFTERKFAVKTAIRVKQIENLQPLARIRCDFALKQCKNSICRRGDLRILTRNQ